MALISKIGKSYEFHSAHYLPEHPRCGKMHGHTYKVVVEVAGPIDPRGVVLDFHDLDLIMKPVIEHIDHRCLNDVLDFIPTAEKIIAWLWMQIDPKIPIHVKLVKITLYETTNAYTTLERSEQHGKEV